jgi:hypothetical protein
MGHVLFFPHQIFINTSIQRCISSPIIIEGFPVVMNEIGQYSLHNWKVPDEEPAFLCSMTLHLYYRPDPSCLISIIKQQVHYCLLKSVLLNDIPSDFSTQTYYFLSRPGTRNLEIP